MSVEQKLITAEELWEMPEVPGKRLELVDGEVVEVPGAGMLHNLIAMLIYELIRDRVRERDLGLVFGDGLGYILSRNPDRVRIPDVSFLSSQRMPEEGVLEGFSPVAPDLAVEIVSPSDRADILHDKVHDYLDAGTQMVWVVWPKRSSVSVHGADGFVRELGSDDTLDGGDVLPGFQTRVGDLFEVGQ